MRIQNFSQHIILTDGCKTPLYSIVFKQTAPETWIPAKMKMDRRHGWQHAIWRVQQKMQSLGWKSKMSINTEHYGPEPESGVIHGGLSRRLLLVCYHSREVSIKSEQNCPHNLFSFSFETLCNGCSRTQFQIETEGMGKNLVPLMEYRCGGSPQLI